MKLIVGLGNPGLEYAKTRHNMGFQAIDRLADRLGVVIDRDRFDGHYALVTDPRFGERFIVLKPQTYMNLSGKSVAQVASFFKIDPADIIVCYDDLDTKPGDIRLRGTHADHGNRAANLLAQLQGGLQAGLIVMVDNAGHTVTDQGASLGVQLNLSGIGDLLDTNNNLHLLLRSPLISASWNRK